jgi:glycosyltransferase involved in cell wall biosynthesis
MRIALFHNLPSGGAKRAVQEWMRQLSRNHVIDVYTVKTADHDFCDIRPFANAHHVIDFTPRRLFNSPLGRLNQLQRWRDLNDLDQLHQNIAQKINSRNYDLMFGHPDIFTLIPRLLFYIDIPVVYYLHEPFGPGFVRQFELDRVPERGWRAKIDRVDPLIQLYQNRLEKMRSQSIHKANILLANSEFTRKMMHDAYDVDAPVCYYGVNSEGFRPMPDAQRQDFVMSVGELSPRKGFDFLIQSIGHIPVDKRPVLKLACNVVHDDVLKSLKALSVQYGVTLEILSGLDTDKLCVLYNQARLCVYAPVLEPFGLVPLEAMACGTAVVGVREGGVAETIVHGETGVLVSRDSKEFGQAVLRLLEDPALAQKMGGNGRAHILENWTWGKSTAEIERHLGTLVK